MKILVLYDSHHGFTERCLGLLAGDLHPGVDLWSVRKRPGVPDWTSYDAIVFGGPVYFGKWAPAVVRFVERHQELVLGSRPVGAFVVSLSSRATALRYFAKNLPPVFKGKLGHVSCFGGGFTWKDLTWWERWLLKKIQKIETDVSNLDLGEIQGLSAWLSANTRHA